MNIMDFYHPKKCSVCGTRISDNAWSGKCRKCLHDVYYQREKDSGYFQKRREEFAKKGLCIRCGGQRDGWQKTCAACREKRNAYARRAKNE